MKQLVWLCWLVWTTVAFAGGCGGDGGGSGDGGDGGDGVTAGCADADGDGYGVGAACLGSDCDDANPGCQVDDCCESGEMIIEAASAEPVIDGLVEEQVWAGATPQPLAQALGGASHDLSARFRALWDARYLYLLIEVDDEQVIADSVEISDDDAVEIYLDADNNKGEAYDDNDFHWSLRAADMLLREAHQGGRSGVLRAVKHSDQGYQVEVAIPWLTIEATPAADLSIGLEVQVVDDDDGGARDRKVAWADGSDLAGDNPSVFGLGRLAGEPLVRTYDYAELGFLDVTTLGADPSGSQDSTAAIQAAIDQAYAARQVVFFPAGTYLVSDTLRCMQPATTVHPRPGHVLLGSTVGPRPTIRLADSAPGYADDSKPESNVDFHAAVVHSRTTLKAVVHFWHQHPNGDPDPELEQSNVSYNQIIRGLDINLGSGNPGAVGIRHLSAEGSSIQDVTVYADGGFAGVYNLIGSGGSTTHLEVVGGKYGIYAERAQAMPVIAGLTLHGQSVSAIVYKHYTPLTVVGFAIREAQGPVMSRSNTFHDSSGHLALIDGSLELSHGQPGDLMVANTDRSIYLKNVYVKGASTVVGSDDGDLEVVDATRWTLIREYAYNGAYSPAGKLIDGVASNDTLADVSDQEVTPPPDLRDRHRWMEGLCSFENPGVVSVSDFGASGDGVTDDTQAIRDALVASNRVLLPQGSYRVSDTIALGTDSHLLGAARHNTVLLPKDWSEQTPTPVIATANDARATSSLCNFRLKLYQPSTRIYAIHWQAGRDSLVKDVWIYPGESGAPASRVRTLIDENGGGRWYNLQGHVGWTNDDQPGSRHVLIAGTSEPLRFYMFHNQYLRTPGEAMSEVRDAENVTFYGQKTETVLANHVDDPPGSWPLVLAISNSNNVALYGQEGAAEAAPGRGLIEILDSTNVTVVNVARRGNGQGNAHYDVHSWYFVRETWGGEQYTLDSSYVLSLFSRTQ